MTVVDIWRHKFLRGTRLSSLLLGKHACQVENRLASEADTVGVINDLTLVILGSERLVGLTLLHQMHLLLVLL